MRIVAYLRVSTDRQAEHGLGIEIQERAVRTWARSNGHRLVAVERDEGISGSNGLDTRVGLACAMELLREQKAQGLVVYRLDRLARDLVLQEQLLAEIKRMGAEAFSTSAGESGYLKDDPDDPSRALIRQVLGAVSQYERSMISLRLKAGRMRKAERGGFAYGSPAFGYRADRGELVADPDEQRAVDRIAELHGSGTSTRAIAITLEAEGLPAKRGSRWHSMTVARIIARAAA